MSSGASGPPVRTVEAPGTGSASGPADRCSIELALVASAATPAEALEQVTAAADAVVAALGAQGVERCAVRTRSLQVTDRYDPTNRQVVARDATYGLAVDDRPLGAVGPLLAALAAVAGDALRVQSLDLGVADPEPLVRAARGRAVADALARAQQLAKAAGVALGPLLSLVEGGGAAPRAGGTRAVAFASSLPVEGGTETRTVAVTALFAIAD